MRMLDKISSLFETLSTNIGKITTLYFNLFFSKLSICITLFIRWIISHLN